MDGVIRHPDALPASFLGRLPPAIRQEMLGQGRPRRYGPGDRLLREGGTDTHVILLTRGFAKVTTSVEGIEALVAIRCAGDLVGEAAALADRPRMASVTACGTVTGQSLTAEVFRRLLARYPEAARLVTATVAERLHWANARRVDFVAFPADVRLARVLVEIAGRHGHRGPDGGVTIGLPLNQRELAGMIGASEDTVQKALRSLREKRLVRSAYRQLTVLDPAALRRMSGHPADPSE
ncbi:Crp/Fnr family transcriptional regulator [Micromonospora sp. NPDC018662]|uniref:Crp/Fnr family transcriptional regulator n=1 Tax=Micromonospora sp. NPDC018662 TaxID=3364238 RepID=UPI00378795B0